MVSNSTLTFFDAPNTLTHKCLHGKSDCKAWCSWWWTQREWWHPRPLQVLNECLQEVQRNMSLMREKIEISVNATSRKCIGCCMMQQWEWDKLVSITSTGCSLGAVLITCLRFFQEQPFQRRDSDSDSKGVVAGLGKGHRWSKTWYTLKLLKAHGPSCLGYNHSCIYCAQLLIHWKCTLNCNSNMTTTTSHQTVPWSIEQRHGSPLKNLPTLTTPQFPVGPTHMFPMLSHHAWL